MQNKHKQFCKCFLETFDFNKSCSDAKLNNASTLELMHDKTSEVYKYITEQIQLYTMQNTFMTKDFIKFKLGEIINNGDNQHKIQSAKLLLEFEDTIDKTQEFKNLIKQIKGT